MATSNPLTKKLVIVAVLTILFLAPQAMLEGLIEERHTRQLEAAEAVKGDWGGPVDLRGPLLIVPRGAKGDGGWRFERNAYAVAESVAIKGDLDAESRYRGLFEARVFHGTVTVEGRFLVRDLLADAGANAGAGGAGAAPTAAALADLDWSRARLYVLLGNAATLAGPATITDAAGTRALVPRSEIDSLGVANISASFPATAPSDEAAELPFTLTLAVKGTERFAFTPFAQQTQATMTADWSSPSFLGSWLPIERTIEDGAGFSARFTGASAVETFATMWQGSSLLPWVRGLPSFGFDLVDAAGPYLQASRAVKYAILFIALTFGSFFLFESLVGLRLHPVQYLAVGAALLIFFLLLLSLSEHIAFATAYGIAAVAVIGLITGYASSILGRRSRSAALGGGLTGLYGYLFVLLQLESMSLVFGAVGLFALLGAFMYATRRVDWYALGRA
jgi:inner membrane protein